MGDLDRLRELLVGDELRALGEERARVADLERSQRELPQRLPEALEAAQRNRGRERVAQAIAEPVALALGTAVRSQPQTIIDALFPVIGPAIRKAIAEAMRTLMEDLNRVLESGFSARGLKWRLEAWRSGVPYAQIVLKHTLRYRIDHVFLIERDSGMVIHRESAPDLPELDADAIAGMLTAIGAFVHDSVGREGGDTLESARVGEHLLWVVEGPRANLACFIRGIPPAALRTLLEQRLEQIHARLADPLRELQAGAADDGARWREWLDPQALAHTADAAVGATASRPSRWPLLGILLLVPVALGWYFARIERWQYRVDALRGRLTAQPGFVLTGIDSRPWRSLTVHGLLDPDAAPLAPLLAATDLGKAQVQAETTGFLSAAAPVVAHRARRLLAPPAGVDMAVTDGVLKLGGRAPAAWIATARQQAPWIAGVTRVDFAVQAEADPAVAARAQLEMLARSIAGRRVLFVRGTDPAPNADAEVAALAGELGRTQALARTAKVGLACDVIGLTDAQGSSGVNAELRARRAHWLAEALAARGVPRTLLHEVALTEEAQEATMQQRGASVRLVLGPASR